MHFLSDKSNDLQYNSLKYGLYIIPTPIGNLDDISIRAIKIIENIDEIYCEDKRHTSKLLSYLGIKKKLYIYNDHSSEDQRKEICDKIKSGLKIALLSDAGYPTICDPGYKLIKYCRDEDIEVITASGACALIMGLASSGVATDRFTFTGFVPAKNNKRFTFLSEVALIKHTIIMYETSNRLSSTLEELSKIIKDRTIIIQREISKLFEEYKKGTASELLQYYNEHKPKGEIVLIIDHAQDENPNETQITTELNKLLQDKTLSEASKIIAKKYKLSKNEIYKLGLENNKLSQK